MFSASSALMSLCILPAGPLAGVLYTLAPKGPFLVGMALQVVALGVLLVLRSEEKEQQTKYGTCGS